MREAQDKRKMKKISCPGCRVFLAYVPVESDVWCPRCGRWVYQNLGGGKGKQEAKKPKGTKQAG